ncbi:MAG: MFS transporter [Pyrinomonadaceae bacterium]|nr:MFS transporter [Pyrinomonadaceae bacterium]
MPRKIRRYFSRYKGLSGNVLALSLVSFLNDTSSEIIYPFLPAFLFLALGATPAAIGVIEGFAESVASLLKLFSGYFSDRFGKHKLPVFAGYSLASIVRPLLAFVTSWQQVLFVRLTDRVGKGIRVAPRDSLLASSVSEEKRGLAFGFNRAADHLGAVVGPVIGFILIYYLAQNPDSPSAEDYRQVFLYASIPIVLGLFVIIFFVHEKKKPVVKPAPVKLSLKGFDGNFKKFLVIISLFTLSNSTDAFLILRAEQAGISLAVIPLLWMALHLSKVVSSLIFGPLSDRVGRRKLIFAGWLLYALVYCGFAFVGNAWQALALFLIYGVYFGLTEGVEKALVADLVPEEKRGTAYGLYNLAFGITVFPASLIFGLIWETFSASTAFLFSASISVVAALLILSIKNPKFAVK